MDGAVDYIALAIPVFFLLIGVELIAEKVTRTQYYRFNDAVANISCGIGQQVLGIFIKTLLLLAYVWIYNNYKLADFPADQWWTWVLLFIGVDFFYYWFHRYAHEISIMWGGHIVHHQSEEYNLSVALRQGAFQTLFSWVFYLPLALIGFDPITFIIVNQFQTLYQFWIHTRAIGKIHPVFSYLFNTPSHHRVHHGINPQYIDKNHGGTLIIWDRLFGTFQAEEEEVVYGVTKPLKSFNAVWANFDYLRDVGRLALKTRSIKDFFKVFLMPPGWRPDYLGGPQKPGPVDSKSFKKFDFKVPKGINYYVLLQFVLVLGGGSLFLFKAGEFETFYGAETAWLWQITAGGLILLSLASLGGLLEGRKWSFFAEGFRLLTLTGLAPLLAPGTEQDIVVLLSMSGFSLISLVWLANYWGFYRQAPPAESVA